MPSFIVIILSLPSFIVNEISYLSKYLLAKYCLIQLYKTIYIKLKGA